MGVYTPPFYFHSMVDTPGVALANNFMSIFNPASSGRSLIFFQAEIRTYTVGITIAADSMSVFRITAASGGTLLAASKINRFLTTSPDSVAQVRMDNPAITIDPTFDQVLNGFPPAIAPSAADLGSPTGTSTPPGSGFVCLPGQGIAFRTASGDVDQRWGLTTIWAER